MDKKLTYERLIARIPEVFELAKAEGWDVLAEPVIEAPASAEEVVSVEKELNVELPEDYKFLFTQCSRHVEFSYQFDRELPDEFSELFRGEIRWSLDTFIDQYVDYNGWVEAWLGSGFDESEELERERSIVENKVPFMRVPNGDLIVIGYSPSEVVYLSHEYDNFHGKRLGNSLFEFLDYHTRVAFTGDEDWQFEPFLRFDGNRVFYDEERIGRWQEILGVART